jgi:hypothetical protein
MPRTSPTNGTKKMNPKKIDTSPRTKLVMLKPVGGGGAKVGEA